MSVLKAHRSESKAEFVNTANKIYVETINFLSRLSARFSRLMANDVSHLASEVLVNAEKANSIFPSDHTRKELRKQHLLESRAALMALDVELSHCYDIMMLNPEGCFTTSNGNPVKPARAKEILENMAQSLGELIDSENGRKLSFAYQIIKIGCISVKPVGFGDSRCPLRIGGSVLRTTTTATTSAM